MQHHNYKAIMHIKNKYCSQCTENLIHKWSGNPHDIAFHTLLPILPKIISGRCEKCNTKDTIYNTDVVWKRTTNINTKLPLKYWGLQLLCRQKHKHNMNYTKGYPYYCEGWCKYCKNLINISAFYSKNTPPYMSNCIECGPKVEPYYETRFIIKQYDNSWPETFAIISGYATTGQKWTDTTNCNSDHKLHKLISSRKKWAQRLIGYSPTTGHNEPSWATNFSIADACYIGKIFMQDAIYYVKNNKLLLIYCNDPQRQQFYVDQFRTRIDLHNKIIPDKKSTKL